MSAAKQAEWERMLGSGAPGLAEELASVVDQLGLAVAAATLGVEPIWLARWVRGTRPTAPPPAGAADIAVVVGLADPGRWEDEMEWEEQ